MTESPPPGHLSDERLAGFIDGTLSSADRAAVESHVADCPVCRAELVAASRTTATAPSPARRRPPLTAIAAAAAAVIVIVVAQRRLWQPAEAPLRVGRSASAVDAATLRVVTPKGDVVTPGRIAFVWHRSDAAVEYTITVQNTDGRVLWSSRTPDTSVALPDSIVPTSGTVLHWYVDGLRVDGGTVGTGRQQVIVR
jgi:hypothetical protein